MTRIKSLLLLLAFLPALAGCGSPQNQADGEPRGVIAISGAFALYPMMTRWAEEYQKLHPGVSFDISAGGAGKGMADALGGAVDIGMVSRDITDSEQSQGAYWVPVTIDAVFPMVSANNPVLADLLSRGVSKETFQQIYLLGDITSWGQLVGRSDLTDPINVYTRSDAAGAPETWAKYLGKKQEDLLGLGVFGDPGLLEAVIRDPNGLGYNNLGYAFDNASGLPVAGAVVLPIDVNNDGQASPDELLETKSEAIQAVANGLYPAPPARALNLVTKGKPTGLVQEFITWILTDGQQYVDEAGYIHLTPDQLAAGLEKLK